FSSREEAICAVQSDRARRLGQALRARPAGEPLGQAIAAAVLDDFGTAEPDRVGLRMIMSTPALEGEALKAFTTAEEPLATAIAYRPGRAPPRPLSPQAGPAARAGAPRGAGRHWLNRDDSEPFAGVLRRALDQILPAADHPGPDIGD